VYHCPHCQQAFLTSFSPCPGCASQQTKRGRSQRARERRVNYDPVGQIDPDEFWQVWRLYPVCPCCGGAWGGRDTISLDHIVPLSRGGPNTGENVQPLCLPCNLWKSDHIIYFARAFVGRVASVPPSLWSYLPPPSRPTAQLDLLTVPVDVAARYPRATAHQLEQATLTLTREQSKSGQVFQV